jgi:hypothetical protein
MRLKGYLGAHPAALTFVQTPKPLSGTVGIPAKSEKRTVTGVEFR